MFKKYNFKQKFYFFLGFLRIAYTHFFLKKFINFFFWDRVSVCSHAWPGTHKLSQIDFKLKLTKNHLASGCWD